MAGGDVTGRILIWRGFGKRKFSADLRATSKGRTGDDEERSGVRGDDDADICSTCHWHHDEVKFLFFSSDGAYLYSGVFMLHHDEFLKICILSEYYICFFWCTGP